MSIATTGFGTSACWEPPTSAAGRLSHPTSEHDRQAAGVDMFPLADGVDAIEADWNRERPDIDVSSVGIITRIWRVGRYLERARSDVLAGWNTDRAAIDILGMLRRAGVPYQRTAGELTQHALITSGGVSQRLEKLESSGLVRRLVDSTDRRRVTVELTPAGVDLIDSVLNASMGRDTAFLDEVLTPDEQTQIRALLRKMLAHFEPAHD